jgi:hypothetical protein
VHRKPRIVATRPKGFTDGIAAWLSGRTLELAAVR